MQPTVVAGGNQALAVLQQAQRAGEPFALGLLDNMMPEMDGFTLVELIHQHPELVGATLMMISSAGRREDALRCQELAVSAYMTKPIRLAELMDSILQALSLKDLDSYRGPQWARSTGGGGRGGRCRCGATAQNINPDRADNSRRFAHSSEAGSGP